MEAEPPKDQGSDAGRNETCLGMHEMPQIREGNEGSLDSFD